MPLSLRLLCFLLFVSTAESSAQNFIPNGDFEQYSGCPDFLTQIDSAAYWFNPSLSGTPEYFNSCAVVNYCDVPANVFGYQNAHSGAGYAGLTLWKQAYPFREYIETPLTAALLPNTIYHLEFYYSLGDVCAHSTAMIGAFFTSAPVSGVMNSLPLPYTAQLNNNPADLPDTSSWKLFSGDFTASGGEQYLIIGNFRNDANTTTTLVNPSSTTYSAYIFVDDVSLTKGVGVETLPGAERPVVFPVPCSAELTVSYHTKPASIEIYSATGQLLQTVIPERGSMVTIPCSDLSDGLYFVRMNNLGTNYTATPFLVQH